MSICPHPCPSGPTGPPGHRLGAGLGLSASIPVRNKRLETGFPAGSVILVLGEFGGGAGRTPNGECRSRNGSATQTSAPRASTTGAVHAPRTPPLSRCASEGGSFVGRIHPHLLRKLDGLIERSAGIRLMSHETETYPPSPKISVDLYKWPLIIWRLRFSP